MAFQARILSGVFRLGLSDLGVAILLSLFKHRQVRVTSMATTDDWVDLDDESVVDYALRRELSASPVKADRDIPSVADGVYVVDESRELDPPSLRGMPAEDRREVVRGGGLDVEEDIKLVLSDQEGKPFGHRDDTPPLREIGVDTPPPDDRQCRICLGGVEDEGEMGRLISPCLCAGSMRFVHLDCINKWRGSGANAKSFLECPQCSYEYHIRRTVAVGIATSRPLQILLTTGIFFTMTLLAGHFLLRYLVSMTLGEAGGLEDHPKNSGHSPFDDEDDYTWHYQSNVIFLGGTALIYDIIKEALYTFIIFAGDIYDLVGDGGWFANLCLDIVIRLLLGLALLGSLSGLTLLASLSLFAPLQLMYALRGTGIFDGIRRRINSRNGTILIVTFVFIGVINSVVQVYDFVHNATGRMLRYVETQIVEVDSPQARQARKARSRQPARWLDRWWAERRWRTAAGWSEVRLRAWLVAKEWFRQVKVAAAAAARGEDVPAN